MAKMLKNGVTGGGYSVGLICPVCNANVVSFIDPTKSKAFNSHWDCPKCGAIVYLGNDPTTRKKLFGSEQTNHYYSYCYVETDSRGNITNKRILRP